MEVGVGYRGRLGRGAFLANDSSSATIIRSPFQPFELFDGLVEIVRLLLFKPSPLGIVLFELGLGVLDGELM